MTRDLGELFRHYGSDKDSVGYSSVYHTLLSSRRQEPMRILEIGIGTMIEGVRSSMIGYALPGYRPGGSLRAWRDYFPGARVYGIDVQPDTQFSEERIQTHICDSTSRDSVDALLRSLGHPQFDVIVDDGSHWETDQLATLANFYPRLADGGLYFLEDIDPESTLNSTPEILEPLCAGDPFFFAGTRNGLCVFYKRPLSGVHRYDY